MAIWVKCDACGRRYQAADHMAGRRVRCKHCGTTFQLPPNPTSADPFEHQQGGAGGAAVAAEVFESPAGASGTGILEDVVVAPRTFPEAAPPRPTPEMPPPFGDEPYDPDADVDSVFQDAFQEFAPARGNTPFVFPGSHLLDQWLPLALVVISLAWLAYQIFSSLDKDPPWVGVVRMLVLLLAYAGIVFPLCLKGVRMAAHKLNYDLPSGAPWRAFATFLLPVTIGCIVWLSSQSVPGFIFGTMMGLVVAMPVMWLLFRIRQDDAPVSLGYGAAAFGAAVLVSALVLVVLNLIVLGVVRGTHSRQTLAMSPFGPNFAWDVMEAVEKSPVRKSPLAASNVRPKQNEPVAPTTKVAFSETPPAAADASTRPSQVLEAGRKPIAPSTGPTTPPTEQVVTTQSPNTPTESNPSPTTPTTPTTTTTTTQPNYGPIVAEVNERMSAEMTGLIQPLLPGRAVAVIRKGEREREDVVERWDAADWRPERSKAFVRPAGGFANYEINANASLLARLTDFPFKAVQVYSFTDNALLTPPIKLAANLPPPYLAGFVGADQLLMFTPAGTGGPGTPPAAEIWDVNRVVRLRKIEIPGLHSEAGSYAISHDGKLLAVVAREDNGPAADAPGRLDVYNLVTGTRTRHIVIDELQWNSTIRPSGVAFNDNASKVAVLFEHQGQGLFLCWAQGNDIPVNQYVYPGGLLPQGANIGAFQGPSFALVDDGNAWIIYGAAVFDSATGVQLGDLKIKDVISQRVVSRDTLFLLQQDGSKSNLLEVRLDVGRARRMIAAKE